MPYTFINNFNNNARLTRGANVLLYWPNVPPQSYLSVSYNYVWFVVRGARFVDHCTTVMHILRVWFNIKHCRYLNRIHNWNVRGKLNLKTQNAIVVEFCNRFQIYKRQRNDRENFRRRDKPRRILVEVQRLSLMCWCGSCIFHSAAPQWTFPNPHLKNV